MVGVVVVVLGVVVGVEAETPAVSPADDEPELVDVVVELGVVDDDPGVVVMAAGWATVSDATRAPRPTAPAVAPTPMATVSRRSRACAESRARRPERGS